MNRVILILLLLVVSCNKKDETAIARITDVLKDDIQEMDVTNAVALFEEITIPTVEVFEVAIDESYTPQEEQTIPYETLDSLLPIIVVDDRVVDDIPSQAVVKTEGYAPVQSQGSLEYVSQPIRAKGSLNVVQQESYIKVGNDQSGITVSKNKSQKITVVVFPQGRSTSVDIYLYAVPTYSHLVRNYNTLIGFAKDIEFVQGQAQFTRHWRASRSRGDSLKNGRYNIYVEYHYKNSRGQVVKKLGRFWGGSHRKWTVRVI